MARRTKEEAAQTREQILEAALTVFTEKGYSKATFVDVAAAISLSKGAVYWHFKTKPDLLAAVIAYGDDKFCNADAYGMAPSVPALREAVCELATNYTQDQAAWNFEFFCSFQIEWSTELMAEVHEKLTELRGDPMKNFEQQLVHLQEIGALDRAADARMLALCFGSTWVGSLHMAMYGQFDKQQFIEVLMSGFDRIVSSQAIPKI
ncbi:TetR family transcriptional regulator [Pontiellaceae bacterium B1224]|nr:TetR family transcriptional regulator [Pontiellaceae bacterium B1224]